MEDHGVKFKRGVVPKKLEKVDGDRIHVTFSDDTEDVYDTVLVAIGRYGDTAKLGLENIGVEVNEKNFKIPTKYEQSVCPNVYVIGDVMEVSI
jgi:pyruvate/2-oxoglutarate dehydrogenase complex dihydrolipoamide dehydrogenase (E3) component